jgi:hypothetical protein
MQPDDTLPAFVRADLERLRLAAETILRLASDPGVIPDSLEVELTLFRDRVEHALLLPATGQWLLPTTANSGTSPKGRR